MEVLAGAEAWTHDPAPSGGVGVLVCHGFTGSPQSVRPVARDLVRAGHAVSVPRLPGHGTTWRAMARTTWADWYTAVEAAALRLRAADPDRPVVLVGLSMGGTLVTRLVEQHPHLAAGLILINPAFALDDARLRLLPVLAHLLPSIPGIAGDIRKPDAEPELAYDRAPLRPLASWMRALPGVVAELGQVRVPVLLLRSAHDGVVPRVSADLFRQRVGSPDVREVWLPDSAHVAPYDHDAPLLLERTRQFVTEVGRT